MEKFQYSVIQAFAAAAGCNVLVPNIDEGIDVVLTHTLPRQARVSLEVQMKAVSSGWNADRSKIGAHMGRERYDELRSNDLSVDAIVVIMDLPRDQAQWIWSRHPYTVARHCCYWVNLCGAPERRGDRVTVWAPSANVFDDVELCGIMGRIRAGGNP